MTTPAWPDTLPQEINVDGNSEAMGDGRLRSQTDTGPGKVRQRSSAAARPLSGTMLMTGDQVDILEDFVTSDLAGGTLTFTFPPLRGTDPWLVQFADSLPSWANVGADNWQVTLNLEVLP